VFVNKRLGGDAFREFHNRKPMGGLTMKTMKVTALAILILLLPAGNLLALDHSGTIAADETWFAADNPHVVVENVTVNAGVTLTIQPGVEVYLNGSRRITTNGNLMAIGAPGQEILFTKNTTSDWSYLYFTNTGSGTLEYCTIEESSYAIYANSSGTISTSNVTMQNCTYGIYITGGSIDLGSTSFTRNATYGISALAWPPTFLTPAWPSPTTAPASTCPMWPA
jgi:hypothetical protein